MNRLSKEYLISFYDRNLLIHGDRPEALRWTAGGQRRQYALLLGLSGDIGGKKVLDYGCGKGDFHGFLSERGIEADYAGFDINPSLIGLARERHPGARFEVFDIEEKDLEEDFDFVFLCGVFNTRVEGVGESFKGVVSRLFRRVRLGLAFTALSSRAGGADFELNYTDPKDMLGLSLSLTPLVSLSHEGEFFAMRLLRPEGS